MVFKRNITITLACVITECLISSIPAIVLFYIFFFLDKINEIFSTLLIMLLFIVIINIFLILISLIAQIFIKTKYFVNKESLIIKTTDEVKEINYNEIANMTYDFGDLTKFHTKSSQLVLFDKAYKQLLSINNPPIIMVYLLKKNCKIAKVNYYHNKRFLYIISLINGIVLLIAIFTKIFY